MALPTIKIPVTCPICGSVIMTGFNAADIARALLDSTPIRLHVNCHDISWFASAAEVTKIRERFYQVAVEIERNKEIKP